MLSHLLKTIPRRKRKLQVRKIKQKRGEENNFVIITIQNGYNKLIYYKRFYERFTRI